MGIREAIESGRKQANSILQIGKKKKVSDATSAVSQVYMPMENIVLLLVLLLMLPWLPYNVAKS